MTTLENLSLNNKLSHRIGLFVFSGLIVLPFAGGVTYAILYSTGLTGLLSRGFNLQPWNIILHDPAVLRSLAFSFYVAMVSIGGATAIALLLLLRFEQGLIAQKKSYLIYLPLCIPAIVAAFLSFQLLGKTGVFSRLAFHLHVIHDAIRFPDLINDKYAIGIILTHMFMAVPFFVIYFSNIYSAVRMKELRDIAATLGSSRQQILQRLLIPILLRKAFPILMLYFIFVLGSYEIPLLLGRQSPQMISLLVMQKVQRFNLEDLPQGYAIALLYVAIVLGVLALFIPFSKKERT